MAATIEDKQYHLLSLTELSLHIDHSLYAYKGSMCFTYTQHAYLSELVEELRFAFNDPEAESYVDRGAQYLINKRCPEALARALSRDAILSMIHLIGAQFPRMTFLQLSHCGFVLPDINTLAVRIDI